MLAIRLARVGRKNVKVFRLIISEKTKHPKRGALEILGYYNPEKEPALFEYDEKKIQDWISKGAQPSPTVARLLKGAGMKGMEKFFDEKKVFSKKTKDPEKLEAEKKAAEEAAAPKEEKPAEEAPTEESKSKEDSTPAEEAKEEDKKESDSASNEATPDKEAPAEEEKKES